MQGILKKLGYVAPFVLRCFNFSGHMGFGLFFKYSYHTRLRYRQTLTQFVAFSRYCCCVAVFALSLIGSLSAQVIDSAVDFLLTENDSINLNVMNMKGFYLEVREPVLLHRHGVPLQTGFGETFFYVLRSDSVFVDGYRLSGSGGAPVYLVATCPLEKISLDPQHIAGRVTLLKGMIDRTDSLITFYTQQLAISKRKADSTYQTLPKNRTLKSKEWKRWDTVMTIHNNNRYFLELYQSFKEYKKSAKLRADFPEFFLSELYNRRTLKYNVISLPEGLPKIKFTEEEMAYQGASKRNKDKYDRPIKKRQLKRESQAGNLTTDPQPQQEEQPVNPNATPPASDENQPPPEGEQPKKDGEQ